MRLAGSAGERVGVDVARPVVPEFGRRLYRLPLRRRLPNRLAGGVTRKLLAGGAGDDAVGREFYLGAAGAWSETLAEQRFSGLLLDYDGTVCWTQSRWALQDARQAGSRRPCGSVKRLPLSPAPLSELAA